MRRTSLAFVIATLLIARPSAAQEKPPGFPPPSHWFGITPSWAHAFTSNSSRDAGGLSLEAFIGPRFSLALVGSLYLAEPAPTRSTPNEALWWGTLESRVTILRSERAELALVGGPGVISTRPVSLVDPDHRRFDYRAKLLFAVGAVARVRVTRNVAVSIEARDGMYSDLTENRTIGQGRERDERSTWYGGTAFMHLVETRIGLTLLFGEK